MRRLRVLALFLLVVPVLFLAAPRESVVQGLVRSDAGRPVAAASVRFQGRASCTQTDAAGRFQLGGSGGRLTATKPGYRVGWVSSAALPLQITLARLPAEDNADYAWIAPGPDPAQPNNCANCHQEIHREWAGSAHGRSADNAKFLALLNGTDGTFPASRDWNLSAQYPAGAGVCANCHTPTFHDPTLEYDFRTLKTVATRAVHCDYCHKIAEAPTDKLGTRFGRDGYPLLRPKDEDLLMFGPLDDAVRPGESFAHAPFYKESRYCASCHEGVLFGVHVYGTYTEWLESPARSEGRACQSCHMAPTGTMSNVAPGKGGIERDPKTLAAHAFPGGTPEMLRKSLKLELAAEREQEQIKVVVELRADNVGHRVPTGFIDRHLVLLVEAFDARGKRVAAVSGPTLTAAAGPQLAGQAGGLYAKRLEADGRSPSPFWVHADSMTDTRLHPGQADRRVFRFPGAAAEVHARVLYRRFWPVTAAPFRWMDNEFVVARGKDSVDRRQGSAQR
jgi:hypothetical protein